MTVREGRWDCQYCAAVGILGRHKACQSCGHSRPEGTKFYLPDANAPAVTNEALLQKARLGPDWVCEFCRSSNAADRTVCHSCQAARGTSPSQQVKTYALGETPRSGDMDMAAPPPPRPSATPPQAKKQGLPKWLAGGGCALLLFLLLCFCGLAALASFNRDLDATVTQLEWERSVAVEAYQTVVEDGWNIPSDGRYISEKQAIHHYDKILERYETRERQVSEQVQVGHNTYVCGQRDLGNGFFEDIECSDPVYETRYRSETYQEPIYREEPVYRTQYTYEIDKWQRARIERASGVNNQPYWPETSLASNERTAQQTEEYGVHFRDSRGREHQLTIPLAEWQQYEVGMGVKLTVNGLGQVTAVNP